MHFPDARDRGTKLFVYFLFSITSRASRLNFLTAGENVPGSDGDVFAANCRRRRPAGSFALALACGGHAGLRFPSPPGLVGPLTLLAAFLGASGCDLLRAQRL